MVLENRHHISMNHLDSMLGMIAVVGVVVVVEMEDRIVGLRNFLLSVGWVAGDSRTGRMDRFLAVGLLVVELIGYCRFVGSVA